MRIPLRIFSTLLALGTYASPQIATATPVSYNIDFTVTYLVSAPTVSIGDVFHGSFTVDDSLLAADGINQSATVNALAIQMGSTWCYNVVCANNQFSGFRGPGGLATSSPGFDVAGGDVVNLRGGVYGGFDIPFIDFSYNIFLPPNVSPCGGGSYCGNQANAFWTRNLLGDFGGTLNINPVSVPEPSTIMLLAFGLAGLGFAVRRKTSEAAVSI